MSEQPIEDTVIESPGSSLANDFYGDDKVEAPVEEVEEQIEVVAEPEDATQEASDDEVEVSSFEQLAEHLETDADWLENLTIKQKINGQEVDIPVGEALKTHRQVQAGDEILSDAKVKAKTIITEADEHRTQIAATASAMNEILKEFESELGLGLNEAEMARLRREDPAEWAAKRDEAQEKQNKLNALKQRAAQAIQNTASVSKEQQQAIRDQRLPQEREQLLQKVPEWSDEPTAEKEQGELVEWLRADGITDVQIAEIAYNGKLMGHLVRSMRYENSKGKVEAVKKRVLTVPKVLKPGKVAEDAKPKPDADDRVSILYG